MTGADIPRRPQADETAVAAERIAHVLDQSYDIDFALASGPHVEVVIPGVAFEFEIGEPL